MRLTFLTSNALRTVLLSLIMAPLSAQNPRAHSINRMTTADTAALQQALDAYDRGDTQSAEPVLRRLVKSYPDNYPASEALGSLYAEAGRSGEALPLLRKAATLAPQEALAHSNLGSVLLKLRQPAAAVKELQAAALLQPRDSAAQANLGSALLSAGQPRSAALAFSKADALGPLPVSALTLWATALKQSGQTKEVMAVLGRIPEAEETADTALLRAELAETQGDFRQAVLSYQAAARLDPTADNLYALTLELLRHWTWDEAIRVSTYAQTRYPDDRRFTVATGIALFADSKYPEAAHVFAHLLAQTPDDPQIADLLGRSCEAAPEDGASDCSGLEAFARAHPENARIAAFAAGKILQRPTEQQDSARAEALLRQALVADPKLPSAWYELGVLQQQRSQWSQSQGSLERAIALRPAYPEAHYRLSRAYAHLGEREKAQAEIALQQKYSQQEKDQLNTRMSEVVRFMLKPS